MIHPLLNSPTSTEHENLFYLTWSPDDQYLAFVNLDTTSPDVTETLYVLDVAKAREDPSIQPVIIPNGFGPSWQPVTSENIAKEIPTPQPTSTSPSHSLIAFTAAGANHELDIYTVYTDGSGETNLTNDSARDTSPVW